MTTIESYLLVIAGAGALMLASLAVMWSRMRRLYSLARHRSADEAYVDLLNYACVIDDGVVLTKDGSLIGAFLVEGIDSSSLTDDDKEVASFRMNQALMLGAGWTMHCDASRAEAPSYIPREASAFTSEVAAALDEERRRHFESLGTLYEGETVISFTYTPPLLATRKFVELMFDDEGRPTGKNLDHTPQLVATFQRDMQTLEGRLRQVYRTRRLGRRYEETEAGTRIYYDDLASHLQHCSTGVNQPIALPIDQQFFLDSFIGNKEFWSGVVPRLGDLSFQVVAIDGFPKEGYPGILQHLAELACTYRWSTRFIFTDAHVAESLVTKFRRKWKQKQRGFLDQMLNKQGHIDEDASNMVDDAGSALADIRSGDVVAGFYNSQIVLMDKDRARVEALSQQLKLFIEKLGFGARIETINTVDAFFSTLPGHTVENVRRPVLNSLNVADLLPISSIWTGDNYAPCPLLPAGSPPLMQAQTTGNAPFRVNTYVNDLGHTAVFGPTRSGKTTLVTMLEAQFDRYPNAQIHVLEIGRGSMPVIAGMGGQTIDVGGEGSTGYAPLSNLSTREDRAWAMNWIDSILLLNDFKTTAKQRVLIGNAIVSHHESGATSFTEFVGALQDLELRAVLDQYTIDGPMGHLLDAREDSLKLSRINAFELKTLAAYGDKFLLPTLTYIFRRIEKSLDGSPTIIVFDECWFGFNHPAVRGYLYSWLKTKAKDHAALILSTQAMDDIPKEIFDVVVESTATKIFLPNRNALTSQTSNARYKQCGLNDAQIAIIGRATPKQDYYLVSEKGARLFQLGMGPLALAFCGSGDKESLAAIDKLRAEYGDGWARPWCASKGLNLDDYLTNEDIEMIGRRQKWAA
jgi:type IV secretion system protein VirB4